MNRRGIGFYLNKVGVHGLLTDDRPNSNTPGYEESTHQTEKQNQFNPKSVSASSYQWFKAEYFYSFADRLFFLDSEINEALEQAELPGVYTPKEWALVRQALKSSTAYYSQNVDQPRTRRLFSDHFIDSERRKLQVHRLIFRELMKQFTHQKVSLDVDGELLDSHF